MKTHPSPSTGSSQCDRILRALQRKKNEWVPMPHLSSVSGSWAVHSRCAELRGRGHIIQQMSKRKGRTVRSYYKLIQL